MSNYCIRPGLIHLLGRYAFFLDRNEFLLNAFFLTLYTFLLFKILLKYFGQSWWLRKPWFLPLFSRPQLNRASSILISIDNVLHAHNEFPTQLWNPFSSLLVSWRQIILKECISHISTAFICQESFRSEMGGIYI